MHSIGCGWIFYFIKWGSVWTGGLWHLGYWKGSGEGKWQLWTGPQLLRLSFIKMLGMKGGTQGPFV